MFFLIILSITGAVILLSLFLFTPFLEGLEKWRVKKEKIVEKELDNLFYDKGPKEIIRLYFILPPVLGLSAFLIFKSLLFVALGALLGLFVPNLVLKMRNSKRKKKFNQQILDAIMFLSSSLKGGLSILQSLEVLAEEMPAPMSQEVGLVVRENKMGVTLEDSLAHLNRKMGSEELNLLVNSVLVARETGGDLTKVLSRVATSIRDNRKLKDTMQTLTLQGRIQGLIMSALPILFITWIVSVNRTHFDIMLHSDIGRTLLFVAAFLQVIGMFLIRKFSEVKF